VGVICPARHVRFGARRADRERLARADPAVFLRGEVAVFRAAVVDLCLVVLGCLLLCGAGFLAVLAGAPPAKHARQTAIAAIAFRKM
jgi:hypothetical protein